MGLIPAGRNYMTVKREIKRLGIDTSHFLGQAHLRGGTHGWAKARPLEEVLVENSPSTYTSGLRKRLLRAERLEAKCASCGGTEWLGKPMPLELDHINGVNDDNRIENLRLLCPNCHALTATYRAKNMKPRK